MNTKEKLKKNKLIFFVRKVLKALQRLKDLCRRF